MDIKDNEVVLKERGEIHEVDGDYTAVKSIPGTIRLDLACGGSKKDGFIGIDHVLMKVWNYPEEEFIQCDLNEGNWPVADNSVMEIHCSHFIEHVQDIKKFMEECHRVLIPDGIMVIIAPYYTAIGAWQDYTHVRAISENTFVYFHVPWLINNNLDHYDSKCDYDIINMQYYFTPEWQPKSAEAQEYARKHYHNVVREILVTMKAVKPIRERDDK